MNQQQCNAYKEAYDRWTRPLRERPKLTKALIQANTILTDLGYAAFAVILIVLALEQDLFFIRCVLVAGISFGILTVCRAKVNAPRPYEIAGIDPLIQKGTVGKSHPSRHTFSMFMIAMCWLAFKPVAGVFFLIAGCFLATVRVLAGVHFPKDVIAGAVFGILCGIIGFWIIP